MKKSDIIVPVLTFIIGSALGYGIYGILPKPRVCTITGQLKMRTHPPLDHYAPEIMVWTIYDGDIHYYLTKNGDCKITSFDSFNINDTVTVEGLLYYIHGYAMFEYFSIELIPNYPVHNLDTGLNYTSIQAAINANETLDGHTIFVEVGLYQETVVVNKSLSLVGEKKSIVNGRGKGTVFTITQDNINITGFRIGGSGSNLFNAGIFLNNTDNCNVTENNIVGNDFGICLYRSSNNTLSGNNITKNRGGIFLYYSSNNSISGNNITANIYSGFYFQGSWHNIISGNNITKNESGISLYRSSNNSIHHNNFINNTIQVQSDHSVNMWNKDHPSEGNYWSDYNGTDANEDGIGDVPYLIDENNQDSYPLMALYIAPMRVLYNELLFNYKELNSTFDRYKESTKSEMSYIRNLMYVFIATTVYFATRKPKTMLKRKTEKT